MARPPSLAEGEAALEQLAQGHYSLSNIKLFLKGNTGIPRVAASAVTLFRSWLLSSSVGEEIDDWGLEVYLDFLEEALFQTRLTSRVAGHGPANALPLHVRRRINKTPASIKPGLIGGQHVRNAIMDWENAIEFGRNLAIQQEAILEGEKS